MIHRALGAAAPGDARRLVLEGLDQVIEGLVFRFLAHGDHVVLGEQPGNGRHILQADLRFVLFDACDHDRPDHQQRIRIALGAVGKLRQPQGPARPTLVLEGHGLGRIGFDHGLAQHTGSLVITTAHRARGHEFHGVEGEGRCGKHGSGQTGGHAATETTDQSGHGHLLIALFL
ncbi:hypothetical protein D3C72_1237920 [compost metagenome]